LWREFGRKFFFFMQNCRFAVAFFGLFFFNSMGFASVCQSSEQITVKRPELSLICEYVTAAREATCGTGRASGSRLKRDMAAVSFLFEDSKL